MKNVRTAEDLEKVNKLISQCNTDNVRKSVGEILRLKEPEIYLLLSEYDRKTDIRFGDNLISACGIVKKMRGDWGYNYIFRD